MKILMICLGNICRSPLAEGIMKSKITEHGLGWEVDSAGTSGWHIGEPPDPRSIETAHKYGVDISHQKSRKIRSTDIEYFDRIYVMDDDNLRETLRYCHTEEEKSRVQKIMNAIPVAKRTNVPDPYFGEFGFDLVYEMLDQACDKIIENAKRGE